MTTDAFEMAVVQLLFRSEKRLCRNAQPTSAGDFLPAPQRLLVRLFARRAADSYHARLGL